MAQRNIVRKVLQLAQPVFTNRRWRKPVLSGRKLAGVRRALVSEGVDWPRKALRDRSADKPLKLTKHEREREARQKAIEENMRNMPRMIEEYRQKRKELREKTRNSKKRTDEELYLIAMGKSLQGTPDWEVFKDKKNKK